MDAPKLIYSFEEQVYFLLDKSKYTFCSRAISHQDLGGYTPLWPCDKICTEDHEMILRKSHELDILKCRDHIHHKSDHQTASDGDRLQRMFP